MIPKKIIYLLVLTLSIVLLKEANLSAKEGVKDKNNNLGKTLDQVARTYLDINQISTQFYNNGIGDIDPSGNAGLIYPKGSGKNAVFTSGLLWGGLVTGDANPRVGGTAYRTGLQPGNILADGSAAPNPSTDPKFRVYRVRPDVNPKSTVDLTAEALNEGVSAASLQAQYIQDWNEWPASLGAPFNDVNGDGKYDPAVDIPGVPGADQTVWYVANDMDPSKTQNLYGALPIGIEVQATFWAYSQTGALGNMYFRKYRLINKGSQHTTVNNMYLSMWADVDLGDAGDDFVGVDTVLSLQYCYNASATDKVYAPLPPPVTGFDFFQGPLVKGVQGQDLNKNGIDDAQDFGIFNGQKVGPGLINLPMTAAYYFANGDPNIGDPPQGDIQGSVQFYNFFQGRFGISGAPFVDPISGKTTTFALSGDPIARTGWVDGIQLPQGDRRQGSASGPFTFSPGDTQEVVVAEMVAGATTGSDHLSCIGLLKFYDAQAQLAYNNFFNLPIPPPPPIVNVVPLSNEIMLNWGEDTAQVRATESNSAKGFTFQGYNVYQLPSASASVDEGVRIATFDVVDGVAKILDQAYDNKSGTVLTVVKQFGNDTGIKRFLDITLDQIKGGVPLINGIKYYFAVTAYSYNPDPLAVPNNLENPIQIITAIPQTPNPGTTYPAPTGSFTNNSFVHKGLADGGPIVNIVDPSKVTGDTYQIYFTQRTEIRDQNGNWLPTGVKKIKGNGGMHPDTLTGSSVDMAAVYGPQTGTIDLQCTLNIAGNGDLADGLKIVLPNSVTVINAERTLSQNDFTSYLTPLVSGHTVVYGDTTHPNTGNGLLAGGETFIIRVQGSLPITANWKVFDDGANGPLDASGSTTDTTIGSISRIAKYWNLKDSTTGQIKLLNQSLVGGKDLFPGRDRINSYDTTFATGTDAYPIVDGIQVGIDISYNTPINFFKTTLTLGPGSTTKLTSNSTTSDLDIQNYTIFGGVVDSWAKDNFGFGTTSINELQKDYYLKFTGVWDSTKNPTTGQVVHFIKPGTGSWATIFRATSLATHPLNPSPGTNAPFLIRIPFEVWSKDDNRQVNLMFRDRIQTEVDSEFWAWNPVNRMYGIIVDSPYDTVNAITTAATDTRNALATWVLVFYGTNYTKGDQVEVDYPNPIQVGVDTYTFKVPAATYSVAKAKSDLNAINVFPNPYYGVNSEELNKYNRFVTFSHLPPRATIRVFNLAGVLVQTIYKDDQTQFTRWNLNNQSNLPVASGLYIAYIDMPDLGATKILKIAIIQEQQILDRF